MSDSWSQKESQEMPLGLDSRAGQEDGHGHHTGASRRCSPPPPPVSVLGAGLLWDLFLESSLLSPMCNGSGCGRG